MAQDTVDAALERLGRSARCRTKRLRLLGAGRRPDLDGSATSHLASRYGTLSDDLHALVAADPSLGEPLVAGQPHLRAEAVYAVRHEMAGTLDDVLSRRTRVRLFDRDATVAAAPALAELMATELGWDDDETKRQLGDFLTSCAHEEAAAQQTATATAGINIA